jgi:hypothetical protein
MYYIILELNKIWPLGQVVKTPPSQGGIGSSILLEAANIVNARISKEFEVLAFLFSHTFHAL